MSVFTLILLTLILGDLVWCGTMFTRLWRLPGRWLGMIGAALFTIFQVGGFLWVISGRPFDLPDSGFAKPLVACIYLWHCLVMVPLIVLWVFGKGAAGILWIGRALARLGRSPRRPLVKEEGAELVTRRDFLSAAVCAAPAVAALGATGFAVQQWNQFRVRRMTVPIPRLPSALDGLTIAQVCDLHVGIFTQGAILDEIVAATNELQPDLVLLPGDLINRSLSELPMALDVVQRLQARHGLFACEGNHDLYDNPGQFRARTLAAGVRLLVNDAATISVRGVPLQVLGLRWGAKDVDPHAFSNRRDAAIAGSMKELLTKRQPDAFPILLAHHPHAFDYAEDIPLTLSGHTHGGQLMLTKGIGCGPVMFRYWTGLYQKDDRALVVSNGVGNWFPLRVQAPAEIVHLTLRVA